MEIDIRNDIVNLKIDAIRVSDDIIIHGNRGPLLLITALRTRKSVTIAHYELDMLILGLQRARELWV